MKNLVNCKCIFLSDGDFIQCETCKCIEIDKFHAENLADWDKFQSLPDTERQEITDDFHDFFINPYPKGE